VVTRKLAVPNPFAKVENLCLTWWQDTREAVRAGFNFSLQKGADVKLIFKMKKILVILVAIIGFGLSANAQMCTRTGNVEPFINHGNTKEVGYNLTNTNGYKVTVTVWVVYKGEVVSNEKTHVIEAGKRATGSSYTTINHWAGDKAGFNKDYLSLRLSVAKCE